MYHVIFNHFRVFVFLLFISSNDYSGFGFGGSFQGEVKPGKRVGITVNAGYIDYFGKTVNNVKYADFKYWPVMGGLKLYLSGKSYIHGQAGPGFGTNGLGTSFWYGGGIGLNLSKAIDAELKYTGWKQNLVTTASGSNTSTGTYAEAPAEVGVQAAQEVQVEPEAQEVPGIMAGITQLLAFAWLITSEHCYILQLKRPARLRGRAFLFLKRLQFSPQMN